MGVLPLILPQWFPGTAIDGSSTRAIWLQVVGGTQFILGAAYLVRGYIGRAEPAAAAEPQIEGVDGDWESDAATDMIQAFNFAAAPAQVVAPADTITLNGEHAELWRAFHQALTSDGPVAHLAARVVHLAKTEASGPDVALEDAGGNVVTFAWTSDDADEAAKARAEGRELVA